MKNVISRLVLPLLDHQYIFHFDFARISLHEIVESKRVKGSASKVNKYCQILLFDFHVDYRTPKTRFPPCISEDDGKLAVSSLHSNVQVLFSIIKAIVLCCSRLRCRPRFLTLSVPVVFFKFSQPEPILFIEQI